VKTNLKISVIIPILNEEASLKQLLDNLLKQTLKPDEILICDTGSSDNSILIIDNYIKKNKSIRLVNKKSTCRGSGRNLSIKDSKNNLIAMIDAGTFPKNNWLEKLSEPIINDNKIKIVYGSVIPVRDNIFEKCLATITIGKFYKNCVLNPTVSSLLIEKNCWKLVGGFPESKEGKYVVEDLIFLNRIDQLNLKSQKVEDAIVYWYLAKNYVELFNRTSSNSRGGIDKGYAKNWHYGILRNFLVYIFLLILTFTISLKFFSLFVVFHFFRVYTYIKKVKEHNLKNIFSYLKEFILISIQIIVIDLASIHGFLKWFFFDMIRNKKN
jgi:glycosyltransferase involved in cell wall biosynthesis